MIPEAATSTYRSTDWCRAERTTITSGTVRLALASSASRWRVEARVGHRAPL